MSYLSQAELVADRQYTGRLSALLVEQAKANYIPEAGTRGAWLAAAILKSPDYWTGIWAPIVAASPGFADTYAQDGQAGIGDVDLLAAVQGYWDAMSYLYESTLDQAV